MQSMTLNDKIASLVELGNYILEFDERLGAHVHRAQSANPWFTQENIKLALTGIAVEFLNEEKLTDWVNRYSIGNDSPKNVGVIAAGNIPLVVFHDVLSVFLSDNIAQIKVSERDQYLLPFLLKKLGEINAQTEPYFQIVERLRDFEIVIATGSNNSARYFNQYFGKYPHIIRMNRNGVAVLTGEETREDLLALSKDVFQYFGLGCRNVSHLFVPQDYNFAELHEAFKVFDNVPNHSKYRNNYDHNLAIFILNNLKYQDTGNVLLLPDSRIISPIGCLYFTEYSDINALESQLTEKKDGIQCVVSNINFNSTTSYAFGMAQKPALSDYADGVDTMQFLTTL